MIKNAIIHRIFAYVKHFFSAWNTTGEGIHSPYLFELVRFVLRDRNSYYCFSEIEGRRQLLLDCEDELEVVDYGSKGSKGGARVRRLVCDIAKGHLESALVGQTLFRLVNWLGEKEKRPLRIVELGTSLGITTAYLASADSRNSVKTIEGSREILKIAQGSWRALKLENIEWKEGRIEDVLSEYADVTGGEQKWDLVYIDANHTYEATKEYVNWFLERMNEKGVIVIDDIHWSEGMEKAWKEVKEDERVTTSMDLYDIGMIFVDKHYLKRHYIIRL